MNKNVIAFQKGFVVFSNKGIDNRAMAMTVQAELMQFGYILNNEALATLGYSDAADIKEFHNEVISYLKDITGGTRNYQPIYKGFPQQVMEISEYDLWLNQMIGYFLGGSFPANEWTKTKGTAFEHIKYKEIVLGTEEMFKNIFKTLVSSGQSLTSSDVNVIKWFIENYESLEFPERIPFKENLCVVFGKMIELNRYSSVVLPKLTTTDVLRIIVYLSGGDVSLPKVPREYTFRRLYGKLYREENTEREKFKFKKFKRKERKYLLYLLENSNLDVREMKLKDQRWIRIGEILHPGDYHTHYPRTYHAFQKLRNTKVKSWYGELNDAFAISFNHGIDKLAERPGEFVRKLDLLIRKFPKNIQLILDYFSVVAMKTSNKVLFEVYTHFENRKESTKNRSIMIKGARKRQSLPDLPAIDHKIINLIQDTVWSAIKEKFKLLPQLGDCWIDENLKKIPLPTNMRSLNPSLAPIIRGERISVFNPLEAKTIRCFIHWYDKNGDIDIDLHGYLMGEKLIQGFGYNSQHMADHGCYSGDVRYRQGACAEYVDIDVKKALALGFDTFLMIAHNFAGTNFNNIKDCVVGLMTREHPESNNIWLPSTITQSVRINNSAKFCLVGAFDLITGEYIHLDLDYGTLSTYVDSESISKLKEVLEHYIKSPKISVYDLLKWHVEARGRLTSKETAETHFLYEDFSGSYFKTLEYLGV